MGKDDWTKKSETFARVRAQIRQVLHSVGKPLDLAELAVEFKLKWRYLPYLERRLAELVSSGAVIKRSGRYPTWELRGDGEETTKQ